VSGLLLLVVGFGLAWIPLVGAVGGILALIGFVYVWNGRHELPAPHPKYVRWAVVCIVLGIVGSIGGIVALGLTVSPVRLFVLFPWVVAAAGAIGLLSGVLLVYAPADRRIRGLLWTGFGAGIAVTFAIAWIESQVFLAFTSGSSSLTPGVDLTALDGASVLLEVIPLAFFAVAYYLVRVRLASGLVPAASPLRN
jgi:hypothetical protein